MDDVIRWPKTGPPTLLSEKSGPAHAGYNNFARWREGSPGYFLLLAAEENNSILVYLVFYRSTFTAMRISPSSSRI